MSSDQERARRARAEYDRIQQEAARLAAQEAVAAAQEAAARESARISRNLTALQDSRSAALARFDKVMPRGIEMITVVPARGRWVRHLFSSSTYYAQDSPEVREPGWLVYHTENRTSSATYSGELNVYFLADGRFVRIWHYSGDMDGQHGSAGHGVFPLEALAQLEDIEVGGIVRGLNNLGRPSAFPDESGRP